MLFSRFERNYIYQFFFMMVDVFQSSEILTYASPAVLSESVSHSARFETHGL